MRQSPFPTATPGEKTLVSNNKIRKALADHGDDGTQVRHVLHFLYKNGNTKCSEEMMASTLRPLGFEIDFSKCKDGVIAEEYREVASADFDSLTQALADLASESGWRYDGFECAVEVAPKNTESGFLKGFSLKGLFGKN